MNVKELLSSISTLHFRSVSNDLIHITDWLPTRLDAAGAPEETWANLDGVSQVLL